MADIRINVLPEATGGTAPSGSDNVAIDGATTRRTTISELVNTGSPIASQAEAEAGTNATKRMTPLTTKQSIASEVGDTVQGYSANLQTLSAVVPGASGTSILAANLSADVRNIIDAPVYVESRTLLKSLNTAKDFVAFLQEDGREGLFKWTSGNFTTHIAADPAEGVYIKADAVAASSGAWVRQYDNDISAKWFGLRPYTPAELIALNGAASVTTRASANSDALDAADALMSFLGGGRILLPEGIIVCARRYERSAAVYLIGEGVGEWEPIFPARPKTWEGTTLLFKGTGATNVTLPGITDQEYGGGWRENPASLGSYFKIFSAHNSDATGTVAATPKLFSAAVMVGNGTRYGGFQHLRIANWIGTDGISDWSNQSQSSLGDDWDFGYLLHSAEYVDDYNIQVVGGWREAAHPNATTTDDFATSERNRIVRAKFQGRRGLVIRAADIWKVTATTTNSVTIRWSSQLYFSPTGGSFRGSDNRTYTYTGVTHTGTAPNYTFTGVTPDPTGIFEVRHPSSGFGNTEYQDVYVYGLDHVNGDTAAELGITDSKALEISGFPIRGVKFRNCKFHTRENVVAHLHINQDILFQDCQFEGGGHFIASPSEADQSALGVAAPVRETRGLVLESSVGLSDGGVNLALFTPRNAWADELQLSLRSNLSGDVIFRPLRTGKVLDLYGKDLTSFFRLEEQTTTTAGLSFVTVSSQTCTWRYIQVGKIIFFNMVLTWTGLDTTDTSAISIRLPVDGIATSLCNATINDRLSTGINLSAITQYCYVDMASAGYLGISRSDTTRLAYNGGQIASAGALHISGSYWTD